MIYIYQYARKLEFMKVMPHREGGMVRVYRPMDMAIEKRWEVININDFKRHSNPLNPFELILDMDVKDDGQIND